MKKRHRYEIRIVVDVTIDQEKIKDYINTAISNTLDNGEFLSGEAQTLEDLQVIDLDMKKQEKQMFILQTGQTFHFHAKKWSRTLIIKKLRELKIKPTNMLAVIKNESTCYISARKWGSGSNKKYPLEIQHL